jgi:hypothetical protein
MKNGWLIIIFLFIPTFYLYSQIAFSDQIIINNSTFEGVNSGSNKKIAWRQNQHFSQLEFQAHLIDANFRDVSSVYSADIDGDGDTDVLGASRYLDEIAWWENLDVGSGSFFKHIIDKDFNEAYILYATDIDGDNDVDVLGGTYFGDEISWWENSDSDTFTKHIIDSEFKWSQSVSAVDIDGDSDIDVIGASKLDSDIAWWENDGSENFNKNIIDGNFSSVNSIYAIDIDGDGDIDVVGARSSQIAWWENDGIQNFSKHLIGENLSLAICVFAIDLDNDGDVDVIGADKYGNEIAWWENNGSQDFINNSLDAEIGWPNWVYGTDLDNDDDVDILAVSQSDNYVCWYENIGSKSFNKHIIQTDFRGASAVHAEDFDNDGDVDIVGAANYANEIYWWENTLLINPNPLVPDMIVEPDTLFFYVGSYEKKESVVSWGEKSSDNFHQAVVSYGLSEFEDVAELTIKNIGNATLYVQNILCDADWITEIDTSHFLLKPEAEQLVTIQCSAEDLFNGIYVSILTINSNDPDTPVLNLPLILDMKGGLDVNFVNEVEPNNRETEAQKIFPPSPAGIKGSISASDNGNISILGDDVEDLFVFTTQSNTIKIKLYDISADLDIFLMTIFGNTINIWGSNHRGGTVDEEFEKTDLEPGKYYVGVSIYDSYPIQDSSSYSLALVGDIVTGVKKYDNAIPQEFSLGQNYPNPFNQSTTIDFQVPKSARITIKIYDTLGKEVRTLVGNFYNAGNHNTTWDGLDNFGHKVSSGVYFYYMESIDFKQIKKALLLK